VAILHPENIGPWLARPRGAGLPSSVRRRTLDGAVGRPATWRRHGERKGLRHVASQGLAPGGARSRTLRVLAIDAAEEHRARVRAALAGRAVTFATARSAAEGLRLTRRLRPDVIVLALDLPDLRGVEAVRAVAAAAPGVPIAVLAADETAPGCLAALRAGADGVAALELGDAALGRTIAAVAAGEAGVSRRLAAVLLAELRRASSPQGLRPVRSNLTPREWEVLDLLCQGAGTTDVAEQLVLSIETVRSHVKAILRKLGVSSRAEAIAVARRLRDEALQLA
jgi:DNA-binding NarL/FixJ family response regulator